MPQETETGREITISAVAHAAGVGESTVSRVLRNHGSFSKVTRDKVMAAAHALGYVPNRIAGTLASHGSHLIAIVVPSLTNIVFSDVLSGASAEIDDSRHQPVFAVTDYDLAREEMMVEAMLAWRPAAVMVAGLDHSARCVTMLKASGSRIVELLDTDGPCLDLCVGSSQAGAGETSAAWLMQRGCRRIGYVGHDPARDRRAGRRFAGFCSALAAGGKTLVHSVIVPGASSVANGRAGLARLLAEAPQADAVYFSNDDMAIGGYFHCLAEGIDVPGKLALFGYNGLDIGQSLPLPLSTIRTPRLAIGREAVRLVISGAAPQTVDLGFELVPGATA